MKITLVNSLPYRDYWYNLRKVYITLQFVLKIYTFIYFKNISESDRTALTFEVSKELCDRQNNATA
jgi:hypothetical protein